MRSVERRHPIPKPESDTRSTALTNLTAHRAHKSFDLRPPNISPSRLLENGLEGFSMGSVHIQ